MYRNHAQIMSHSRSSKTVQRSSEIAHIDGYKQLTCFFMLTEMNQNTSQLYVYPKSHKFKSYNYNRAINIEDHMKAKEFGITAKRGDLVIFNSGSLWHKGFSRENKRIIMNFILTTGWIPTPDREDYDADYLQIKLQNEESFIKIASQDSARFMSLRILLVRKKQFMKGKVLLADHYHYFYMQTLLLQNSI